MTPRLLAPLHSRLISRLRAPLISRLRAPLISRLRAPLVAPLVALLILLPAHAGPAFAEDDSEEATASETCPPLPASALQKIARVMDLVQAQKPGEALQLADSVVRDHPCHVSFQARASCEQLMRKHRQAIDDFRRAYGLVKESYDLEGMARSAIAIGDLQMAARVSRALRAFPYQSQPERARGMRCVQAIAAAANMLLEQEQEAARARPVAHSSNDTEESE